VHRSADGQRLVAQRAVRLPHFDDLLLDFERFPLSVQDIAIALERQPVDVCTAGPVRRLGPGDELREALTQHREANPDSAVRGDAWSGQLHFEIRVVVAPEEMRVAQEQRVARRRLRRTNRPPVRSVRFYDLAARFRVDAALAGQPVVVNDAQAVRVDIVGCQRQHGPGGGAERVPMLIGPGVQSRCERANERAKLGGLL
jgi:hypothetical protein